MTRRELANKAFQFMKKDFGNVYKETKYWQVIAETSDDALLEFVNDKEKENE